MRRKKLYLGALLFVLATSTVAIPQSINAQSPTEAIVSIEKKQKKIKNNPHIPNWKKKVILKKLNQKKALLQKKYAQS